MPRDGSEDVRRKRRSGVQTGRDLYDLGQDLAEAGTIHGWERLARISHHLTIEARYKPAITALRLLTVLNVLFKYASAR